MIFRLKISLQHGPRQHSKEKSAPELKTPADFYNKGLELFAIEKPEKAYDHFSEAWKRSLDDSEPHLIEESVKEVRSKP